MSALDGKREHASRADTERRQYDRLRDAGIPHEKARTTAGRASELVHRGQDKLANDANPRRKDR